jgi:threonine dehydratase
MQSGEPSNVVRLPRALDFRGSPTVVSLERVYAAEARLMPYLRHTPLLNTWVTRDDGSRLKVSLKLENQQVTGSYTVRGVLNAALDLAPSELDRGLVGHGALHGSAVAYAGHILQVPTVVYVHDDVTSDVLKTLKYRGARVITLDDPSTDARERAIRRAERDGFISLRPSTSPSFMVGYATIALEILDFMPELEILVAPVGLGALVAAIAAVLKQVKPSVRVIGVDKYPNAELSLPADRVATVKPNQRMIGQLLPNTLPAIAELFMNCVDEVVFVTEEEAAQAARVLWTDMEVRTSDLGSDSLAAILTRRADAHPAERVGAIITTAGADSLF